MKIVAFYAKQIFALGSLGFVLWLAIGWWRAGWFWSVDAHWAWLISLAIVGLFLVLVCTPIQLAVKSVKSNGLAYALGVFSGPAAVVMHLALNSRFPPTISDFVVRHASMHVLFASLGLAFAVNYRRRFGPNNSFKPSPLRGLGAGAQD